MKNARMTICLMATILVMTAGQGFSVIEYKDGGTHNIISTINDDVWVDYQAPGIQTTVNFLTGGGILSPNQLRGYNNSSIILSDVEVRYLYAQDSSHLMMNSGWVGGLYVSNSSQFTMSSGQIYDLQALDSSQLMIKGGSVNDMAAFDSIHLTMSGGGIRSLWVYDSSQLTMCGGSVTYLYACDNSQLTMSGGWIWEAIALQQNAILTLNGSNFAVNGVPFSSGEIASILGGFYDSDPFRTLTGTLANGNIINTQFRIGETAKIVLIPEPASLLLLGLGGFLIRKR